MDNENSEIRIKRKKKTSSANTRNKSVIKVAGLSVVLLLVILACAAVINKSAVNITSFDFFSSTDKNSSELFYKVNSDSVRDLAAFSDGLVVLTDTAVTYLDSSGNQISSNAHKYTSPVMDICGKAVLLYDRGAKSLRVERNASVYSEISLPSAITVADIGKKGNYAYVLNSDAGYQSHMYVYSYNGKMLFEWGSASDYIIDVALSDNGKYAAVVVSGVQNAQLFSKVLFFNFDYADVIYTAEFPSSAVYSVDFADRKNVLALTETGLSLIASDGTTTSKLSYLASELAHLSDCHYGLKCSVISQYGNESSPVITVFSKKCEPLFEKSYSEKVICTDCSKTYALFLFSDNAVVFNNEGIQTGSMMLGQSAKSAVIAGRRVYILLADGVYSFSVNETADLTVSETEQTTAEQTTAEETTLAEAASQSDTSVSEQTSQPTQSAAA